MHDSIDLLQQFPRLCDYMPHLYRTYAGKTETISELIYEILNVPGEKVLKNFMNDLPLQLW